MDLVKKLKLEQGGNAKKLIPLFPFIDLVGLIDSFVHYQN